MIEEVIDYLTEKLENVKCNTKDLEDIANIIEQEFLKHNIKITGFDYFVPSPSGAKCRITVYYINPLTKEEEFFDFDFD